MLRFKGTRKKVSAQGEKWGGVFLRCGISSQGSKMEVSTTGEDQEVLKV